MMQEYNQKASKKKLPISFMLLFIVGTGVLLFFNTTHVQYSQKSYVHQETVEVAIAKLSLPAMTVITKEHINTEIVSRDELPKGRLVDPKQIIGSVISIPVVEGQILTESCFVPEGNTPQLIAQIPYGMRAFTMGVSSKAMPDKALLYPGCVVDVLVSYKLPFRDTEREALSTTMLRGIQVLAISGESIGSNPESEEEKATQRRNSSRGGALVTLLVDTRQAEALSLAIENGNITLSIRNLLDKEPIDEKGSVPNRDSLCWKDDPL